MNYGYLFILLPFVVAAGFYLHRLYKDGADYQDTYLLRFYDSFTREHYESHELHNPRAVGKLLKRNAKMSKVERLRFMYVGIRDGFEVYRQDVPTPGLCNVDMLYHRAGSWDF